MKTRDLLARVVALECVADELSSRLAALERKCNPGPTPAEPTPEPEKVQGQQFIPFGVDSGILTDPTKAPTQK